LKNKILDKDKKDWEDFLNRKEKLPNKDYKNKERFIPKTKSIDLHGYTLQEANIVIEEFINNSHKQKINKLIVVTGKGLHSNNENNPYISKNLSILKNSVPEFIKKNQNLMKKIVEFKDAEIKDGGSGAFYIYLKKS
jgi:Uncharacterized protein conserved in bacteria